MSKAETETITKIFGLVRKSCDIQEIFTFSHLDIVDHVFQHKFQRGNEKTLN